MSSGRDERTTKILFVLSLNLTSIEKHVLCNRCYLGHCVMLVCALRMSKISASKETDD